MSAGFAPDESHTEAFFRVSCLECLCHCKPGLALSGPPPWHVYTCGQVAMCVVVVSEPFLGDETGPRVVHAAHMGKVSVPAHAERPAGGMVRALPVLFPPGSPSSQPCVPCASTRRPWEVCAGCGGGVYSPCAVHVPWAGLSSRHRLSLLERVSAEAVTTTLHQVTRERMEDRCRGEYERSFLREFHKVSSTRPPLGLCPVRTGE